MNNLVEIDSNVASEANVCIMVPTAGERMRNLKNVLIGAFSQRLWPSTVPASRQLRIAVLDEKGRREVALFGLSSGRVVLSVWYPLSSSLSLSLSCTLVLARSF